MLESFNDSQMVQNNSFSNLDLELCNLQLLKQNITRTRSSKIWILTLSNKIDALRQICKTPALEILNSKLTDAFFPLIGEAEIIMKGAKWFL